MKRLVTILLLVANTSSFAAFNSKMKSVDVRNEIKIEQAAGKTLETIVKSAMAAGINPVLLTELMTEQGYSKDAVITAAISNGADPITLLAATASGERKVNGDFFKFTPAPTIGGGGHYSVSKS